MTCTFPKGVLGRTGGKCIHDGPYCVALILGLGGKSTLALSFFRFVEATEGKIVVDGIDIASLGLTDLRSRITIVPQDPTILSGSLRSTLDVFEEYEDVEIVCVLIHWRCIYLAYIPFRSLRPFAECISFRRKIPLSKL